MLPCPYCGYEVPKQAPLFGWIARLFGKKRSTSELGRLADGVPGTEGIVEKLATDDKGKVQKMTAMGVLPGTPIKLIRRFPAFVFQAGYSQFAVDRSLAKTVLVKWKKPHKNAGA
ncbi:MAG: ferrous iron transport protein A [Deltaproteobacteria bacterium]|nr:ferrous iron transport protein A [Deltaproteobacteria bacterium]